MIYIILVVLVFTTINGQVQWWQLPGFYLNEPGPVPSLLDALRYASSYDPAVQGFNYSGIADACYAVKMDNPYNLNREEQAAVVCYTRTSFLNHRVNHALRSLNTELLNAWSRYLKLFHIAVNKLNLTKPETICRGDPLYRYGSHRPGSVVTLPLSFSANLYTCNKFALINYVKSAPSYNCSVVKLIPKTTKLIRDYSVFINEEERIMLPGTIAVVDTITPGSLTTCTQYLLVEIDRSEVSNTTDVTSLIDDNLPQLEIESTDNFIRTYYQASYYQAVLKPPTVTISAEGGRDDCYNPFSYIKSLTIVNRMEIPNPINKGQIIVAVNGNPTRGLLAEEVQELIADAESDSSLYVNYTLADRDLFQTVSNLSWTIS